MLITFIEIVIDSKSNESQRWAADIQFKGFIPNRVKSVIFCNFGGELVVYHVLLRSNNLNLHVGASYALFRLDD